MNARKPAKRSRRNVPTVADEAGRLGLADLRWAGPLVDLRVADLPVDLDQMDLKTGLLRGRMGHLLVRMVLPLKEGRLVPVDLAAATGANVDLAAAGRAVCSGERKNRSNLDLKSRQPMSSQSLMRSSMIPLS